MLKHSLHVSLQDRLQSGPLPALFPLTIWPRCINRNVQWILHTMLISDFCCSVALHFPIQILHAKDLEYVNSNMIQQLQLKPVPVRARGAEGE
jgi:ABC-type microcin C transport system permease subunit YejE